MNETNLKCDPVKNSFILYTHTHSIKNKKLIKKRDYFKQT